MLKLILHIGDEKCGSSAIQAALRGNSAMLEAQGILYRARHNHFGLISLIGRSSRSNSTQIRQVAYDNIAEMRARIEMGGITHVILSAESFISRSPRSVGRIIKMVQPDFVGVDVVAYVREPSAMYLSWTQQRLKGDHLIRSPEGYHHPLDNYLIPWIEMPGVDSVTVRVFDRSALTGGSVVTDFASILSRLTGQDVALEDVEANTSLTAEQMVILQQFRARFEAEARGKRTRDTNRLIALFHAINTEKSIGTKPRLQPRWERMIRARAAPVFQRLDAAFPGLAKLTEGSGEYSTDAEGPPSNARDVLSVIEPVEDATVRLFKNLIPRFRTELRTGLPEATAKALRIMERRHGLPIDKIVPAVQRYWQAEGAASAAAELPSRAERIADAS